MLARNTLLDTCISESYFNWDKPIMKQSCSNQTEFNSKNTSKNNEQDSLMTLEQITHLSSSYDQADIQANDKGLMNSDFSSTESEFSSWNLRYSSSTTLKGSKRAKHIKQSTKKMMMEKMKDLHQKQCVMKKKIHKANGKTNKKFMDYNISYVYTNQKQDQSKSLHLQGGLIISQQSQLKNQKTLKNQNKQNQQMSNEIGMEIKCTFYENHIFNSYFAINVQYVNEPLSQLPIKDQLNKSNKVKQLIEKHIQQEQLESDRLTITKILEQSYQLNVQKIIEQRESFQREQIINYINTNFSEESFYTIHVFSADFIHHEVNLNKIAFSHKLLSLLNFEFQKCSLSQCQSLLNQFFSSQSYESLQLNHFSLINNNTMKQSKNNTELSIHTFDNISLNCPVQIQMVQFQYTGQTQHLFGNLNERAYIIKYNIDQTSIQKICQSRIQSQSKCQKPKQKHCINQINMLNSPAYSQSSYQFIKQYYQEDYNKFLELQKLAENDIEENQDSYINQSHKNNNINIFNKISNIPNTKNIQKKHNQLNNQIGEGLISKVINQANQNTPNLQQSIYNNSQSIINNNYQNQQSQKSCILSKHFKQNIQSQAQNQDANNQFITNSPLKTSQKDQLHLEQESSSEIRKENIQFNSNLQQYLQEQQYISEDDFDDDDDESEDIDILILKIKLVKRYQAQMQQLKQQQMLQMKEYQEQQKQLIKSQSVMDNQDQYNSNEEQNAIIVDENCCDDYIQNPYNNFY